MEYTIGLDVGSSSVKASVLEIETGRIIGSYTSPVGSEFPIIAPKKGWAEQDPETWWQHSKSAILGAILEAGVSGKDVKSIGIDYQMHALVPVDENGDALRKAIIWCDGRTVKEKNSVESDHVLSDKFLEQNLNLPGHFTASRIAWFKNNEPELYAKMDKALLPGHYVLRRATGESTVTASGLSEGVLWNFRDMRLSDLAIKHFGLDTRYIPEIKPTFGEHGKLSADVAVELGLQEGTPFTYFAGDQPGNAFALNVLEPGQIAATVGTSAVVCAITDRLVYDTKSRVSQFLHVNSSTEKGGKLRIGIFTCLSGAGLSYRYMKDVLGGSDYKVMNEAAASVQDTDGLIYIPFGNGPERTHEGKNIGAHFIGLDLNRHTKAHIYRAVQEGIVYGMKEGAEVIKDKGIGIKKVKAGYANMFLSPMFSQMFADALQVNLELYLTDGSAGAARGAAVGLGLCDMNSAFKGLEKAGEIKPQKSMGKQYEQWRDAVSYISKK